ncbi:hypothetical protein QBC38DRAFT_269179 [Podospora fimiseda]|uniref:Uncharacterized protein n=1 Tax=Podospora fimiseda TaxID=252190 RepID=A0AAN7BL06_9PEZI|nr:hypothetical protein QBC38DRAFT_269179 [Podospora fimiseda]
MRILHCWTFSPTASQLLEPKYPLAPKDTRRHAFDRHKAMECLTTTRILAVKDTRHSQRLGQMAISPSREKTRPITISDLPLDILRIILDELVSDYRVEHQHMCTHDKNMFTQSNRMRKIESLHHVRLSCRHLCEAATLLLFQVLPIDISAKSLKFLKLVSKNRSLASARSRCFAGV